MSNGDWAAWIGAVGTWAIGAVALRIAYVQYRHGTASRNPKHFKPKLVRVIADLDRRILVQLVNEGPASDAVTDVAVLPPGHQVTGDFQDFKWEIDWHVTDDSAVPFLLEGYASANLVLAVADGADVEGLAVRIDYAGPAADRKSDCRKVERVLQHPLAHTTEIRPAGFRH